MAENDPLTVQDPSPSVMGDARLADDASMQQLNALQSTSNMGALKEADDQSMRQHRAEEERKRMKEVDLLSKVLPDTKGQTKEMAGIQTQANALIDPKLYTDMTVNWRATATLMGKPLDELDATQYGDYKSQIAVMLNKPAPKSESEYRSMLSEYFVKEKNKDTALNELYGNVVLKAFQDTNMGKDRPLVGLPTDYVKEWEAKHKDLIDGDAGYHAQANRVYNQTLKDIDSIRGKGAETFSALMDFTQGKADNERIAQVAEHLASSSPEERQKVYRYVGLAAETGHIDRAGLEQFAINMGQSFTRGFDFVPQGNLQQQESAFRDMRDTLASGDVWLRSDKGTPTLNDVYRPSQAVVGSAPNIDLTGRKATPKEIETLKAQAESGLKTFGVIRELRNVAKTEVDPIRPVFENSAIERGAYGLAGSLGIMVPVAMNPVIGTIAYQAQEYDRIMLENPNINPTFAEGLALFEGAGNAALDRLQLGAINGKLPVFGGLLNGIKNNGLRRVLTTVGVEVLEQNLQEGAQDLIAPLTETLTAALREDMPDKDFGALMKDYVGSRAETFFAVLPLALLGGGIGTYRDLKNPAFQMADKQLEIAGFGPSQRDYINQASSMEEKATRIQEEWSNRTPENINAGKELLAASIAEAKQSQGGDTIEVNTKPDGASEWIVRDPAGKEVARVSSEAEAATIVADRGEAEIRSQANVVADLLDSDWRKDKLPNFEAQFGGEVSPEILIKEAEAKGDTKLVESIKASIEAHGANHAELSKLRILGESWVTPYAEGQYKAFVKLNEGATALDAFEELAHNIFDIDLAEGRITKEQAREWVSQAAAAGVANYKFGTDAEVRESMAQIAQDFAHNKLDQTTLPSSFVAFLKKLYTEFVEFMRRAKLLDKAFADGKIDAEFERYLMGKVGLSDASMIEREVSRIEGQRLYRGTTEGGDHFGFQGKFYSKNRKSAEQYGNITEEIDFPTDAKILTPDDADFKSILDGFEKTHPDDAMFLNEAPEVDGFMFPSEDWVNYLKDKGYDGTSIGKDAEDVFLFNKIEGETGAKSFSVSNYKRDEEIKVNLEEHFKQGIKETPEGDYYFDPISKTFSNSREEIHGNRQEAVNEIVNNYADSIGWEWVEDESALGGRYVDEDGSEISDDDVLKSVYRGTSVPQIREASRLEKLISDSKFSDWKQPDGEDQIISSAELDAESNGAVVLVQGKNRIVLTDNLENASKPVKETPGLFYYNFGDKQPEDFTKNPKELEILREMKRRGARTWERLNAGDIDLSEALRIAEITRSRHEDTLYDAALRSGMSKEEARLLAQEQKEDFAGSGEGDLPAPTESRPMGGRSLARGQSKGRQFREGVNPSFSIRARDEAYDAAVKAGDEAEMQRLVDEAAKEAGYTVGPVYHGTSLPKDTPTFTEFAHGKYERAYPPNYRPNALPGFYFTSSEANAKTFAGTTSRRNKDGIDVPYSQRIIKSYLKIDNPMELDINNLPEEIKKHRSILRYVLENGSQNDGVILRNMKDRLLADNYVVQDPSQIKSADPITRDDAGNVIPLSQRFNPESNDIRFSIREMQDRLDEMKSELPVYSSEIKERDDAYLLDLYNSDKTLVGSATFVYDPEKKSIVVIETGIEKKFRGKGFGQALYREIAKIGQERGAGSISGKPVSAAALRVRSKLFDTEVGGAIEGSTLPGGGFEWAESKIPSDVSFSIQSQEQIDRVNKAVADTTMFAEGRMALYEKAKERFKKVLAENKEILDALKEGGAAPEKIRRQKLIQGIAELEVILRQLPAEVRGKVGGFGVLARGGTGDAALADFFKNRLQIIDKELEKHLAKEYLAKIEETLQNAKPRKGPNGVKKSTLGAVTQEFADKAYEASLLDNDATVERLDSLEKQIAKADDPKKEAELVDAWAITNTFGALAEQSSSKLKSALDFLKKELAGGRAARKAAEQARIDDIREKQGVISKALPGWTDSGLNKVNSPDWWNGLKDLTRQMVWSHASYEQILRRVLPPEAQGIVEEWSDRIRKANNKTEAAAMKNWQNLVEAIQKGAGGKGFMKTADALAELGEKREGKVSKLEGRQVELESIPIDKAEQLVRGEMNRGDYTKADLQQIEDALIAMPIESRKKHISIYRVIEEGRTESIPMTLDEMIFTTMAWEQADVRVKMENSGWTQKSYDAMQKEIASSKVATAVKDFLKDFYRNSTKEINPVFSRMFGMGLPDNPDYAPTSYESRKSSGEMSLDGGAAQSTTTPGFAKARVTHNEAFKITPATQIYQQRSAEQAQWVAFAELHREMNAVLNGKNVRLSMKQENGKRLSELLGQVLHNIAQGGGVNTDAAYIKSMIGAATSGTAVASMGYNLKTIFNQFDSVTRFLYAMPLKDVMRAILNPQKVIESLPKAWHSEVVQNRILEGSNPAARFALKQAGMNPSKFLSAWYGIGATGLKPMQYGDGALTTLSSAIVYADAHAKALKEGLSEKDAEARALDAMDAAIWRFSQPVMFSAKSPVENNSHAAMKLLYMFASDARLKTGIIIDAVQSIKDGKGSKADHLRRIGVVFLGAILAQTVSNIYRDLFSDDDDDEIWTAGGYAKALALAPFQGLFLLGTAIDVGLSAVMGQRAYANSSNPLVAAAGNGITAAKHSSDLLQTDDTEAFFKELGRIARAISITPVTAVPAAVLNPVKPIVGAKKNLDKGE